MRNLAMLWVLAACLLGCGYKYAKDKAASATDTVAVAAINPTPTISTFEDSRDGKIYKKVAIGKQVWMAENLNYAAEGSVCYDNKMENCAKYGRLYNWETAITVCPDGTHLPTDTEWITLLNNVGNQVGIGGTRLKTSEGWNNCSECTHSTHVRKGNGTDDYGFSALPGGGGYDGGFESNVHYAGIDTHGSWWSATGEEVRALCWSMSYHLEYAHWGLATKDCWFSVRCVLYNEKER